MLNKVPSGSVGRAPPGAATGEILRVNAPSNDGPRENLGTHNEAETMEHLELKTQETDLEVDQTHTR
jgi:hypothetical protein